MIYYRRPGNADHVDVPPELVGFVDLSGLGHGICHTFGDWHIVGVCDPLLWRPPADDAAWIDGPDGWQVFSDDRQPHPGISLRGDSWCKVILVHDASGRAWAAPHIVNEGGERCFPVRYVGREFIPTPTDEQKKALAIAAEARALLTTTGIIDPGILLPWAAWLLSLTTHLSIDTIAVLGVLDETLALSLVEASAGLKDTSDDGHG